MLGDVIRELRLQRNLIQSDIADRAKISRSWLSRVEANAIATPDPKKLRAVAKVLNVEADQLLTAAGYIIPEAPIERMSRTDILDQVDRLMGELRRREASRREDSSGGRRLVRALVGVPT